MQIISSTFNQKTSVFIIALCFICVSKGDAQEILGVSARYDNDLTEWIVYASSEKNDGYLEARNIGNNRLYSWRWEIYGKNGNIERSYTPQRKEWRLDGRGEVVTIRPVFPSDLSQWFVTNDDQTLKVRYRRDKSGSQIYWEVSNQSPASFEMYTVYGRDIRDWEIIDKLPESISLNMKMAVVFIVLKQHLN